MTHLTEEEVSLRAQPTAANLYENTAWLYDLRQHVIGLNDTPFYVEQARNASGPILELSCGTGRVTIPIAEAGCEIWATDLSSDMLSVLQSKLSKLPAPTSALVHASCADMSHFTMDREFALIVIPASSFVLLTEQEKQAQCLECVRKHLAHDGLFLMDLSKIGPLDGSWLVPGERPCGENTIPGTSRTVRQFVERKKIDTAARRFWVDIIFDVEQEDGSVQRYTDELCQTYFSYEQIRNLLVDAGFTIEREIGDYEGMGIHEGSRMVFFCRAPGRQPHSGERAGT